MLPFGSVIIFTLWRQPTIHDHPSTKGSNCITSHNFVLHIRICASEQFYF